MTAKPRDNRMVLGALLLLCAWLVYDRQQLRRQLTGHAVTVDTLATAAQPLTLQLTKPKAVKLSQFYRDLADVVARDESVITTTAVFRVAHGRALGLAFGKTETAGEPKVGELVDAVFFAALGKQDKQVSPQVRADIVAAAEAVAVACEAVRR